MDGSEKVRQHSGFKTRKEAEKEREKTLADLYNGSYTIYSNVSVSKLFDYWLENDIKKRVGSYNTYDNFRRIVKNHIKPKIGSKQMCMVSRADVQRLYKEKAEESESVVKQIRTIMNIAFRYAADKKIIPVNVASGVSLPKKY